MNWGCTPTTPCCRAWLHVNAIGELYAGRPHVQFDEGTLETGLWTD